ncbi:MAG: hypothetical protein V1676_06530 [Candidatus Diapherotrites archaeon]
MRARNAALLIGFFLLMLMPSAFSRAGFESLFEAQIASRGMLLYFAAFVVLLAIPFMNRYLAIVAIYFIAFALSRGLMRITDEQDTVRTVYSIGAGFELGLKVALPLLAAAALWLGIILLLKRLKFVSATSGEEIIERINRERRKGKSLDAIKGELIGEGVSAEEIGKALRGKGGN